MQNTNWQAVFFDFLVAGVIILVIFRLLRYLLPLLFARRQGKAMLLRALPLIEMPAWAIYLSWYTLRFAEIRSVYAFVVTGILLVILFWFSRFLLRDLIAGVVFRATGRFRQGEVILHGQVKGNIREFRLLSMEVETADGQSVFIPYSALAGSVTVKQESADQAAAYNFSFPVAVSMNAEEAAVSIREYVAALPWSTIHKVPSVSLRKEAKDTVAEVTAYPLEKSFGKTIERHTANHFGAPRDQG